MAGVTQAPISQSLNRVRFRRFVHLLTGVEIVTIGLLHDPVAVPSAYTIEAAGSGSHHPQEVAQAGLKRLRVRSARSR
jgi:hypothetical protein